MVSFHLSFIIIAAWLLYCASTYARTHLRANHFMKFLSSPFFAPFSRLCFCVYFVHVPLTWFNVHSARYPQVRNEFGAVSFNFLQFLFFKIFLLYVQTQFVIMTYANSIFSAMFLHLFFEAPFAKATQLLFSKYDQGMAKVMRKDNMTNGKTLTMSNNDNVSVEKAMVVLTTPIITPTSTNAQ